MTWTCSILFPLPASFFHLLAQEEHRDQVLRGRRHPSTWRTTAAPARKHGAASPPMLFPENRSAHRARDNASSGAALPAYGRKREATKPPD
jgi:hypothetical protein